MPNPKQARGFAKAIVQRNKSDKIDAKVLSQSIVIAKEEEIKVPHITQEGMIFETIPEVNVKLKELFAQMGFKMPSRI